jgi:hypothetical protein
MAYLIAFYFINWKLYSIAIGNFKRMEKNVPHTRSYSQCVELIQQHLKEMSTKHGALKKWCTDHNLNYKGVVKIKNGSMSYYVPQFLLKILSALGYRASITRKFMPDRKEEDVYIIEKVEDTDLPEKQANT